MVSLWQIPSALILLLGTTLAWDCKDIKVDEKAFNLESLAGPKEVHRVVQTEVSLFNTTFTIDLCKALPRDKPEEACEEGAYVCGVERLYNKDNPTGTIFDKFTIAGDFPNDSARALKPKTTFLESDSKEADAKPKGLRIELHGGVKSYKAVVDLVCDMDATGNKGFETRDNEKKLPDLDAGKDLQVIGYTKDEQLHLEWKTKQACEGQADKAPPSSSKSAGWGFFTWFIIIAFLLAAAYIIFGSWLNYQRYGSRGFDLIPHSDTIRDLPYVIKEWVDRLRSGGPWGGYSAV